MCVVIDCALPSMPSMGHLNWCVRKGCHSWVCYAEWLRQLLEPALAATLNNDARATAAASSALTALATLEGLSPGSLQSMMLEVTTALALFPDALQNTQHTHSIQATTAATAHRAHSRGSSRTQSMCSYLSIALSIALHLDVAGVQECVATGGRS